jgi:hypothetical protein
MKTKPFCSALCVALLLFGCKKEELTSNKISSDNVSDYATNGVVTAQVSIAPPVTQQTFIPNAPNGNQSTIAIDISSTKHTVVDNLTFVGSDPQLAAVNGHPYDYGTGFITVSAEIKAGTTLNQPLTLTYHNVTDSSSPFVTSFVFKQVEYHVLAVGTEQYNQLDVDSASGSTFSMCLVNNVAHLQFRNPPAYKKLSNGYVEIARIALTGDTSFTLNALPLHFYYDDFGSRGNFPDRINVAYNGAQIAVAPVTSNHQSTIQFANGFKHIAGKTEVFRIFGHNFSFNPPGHFYTEMGDLNNLVWKDGLGGLITGDLNSKYYKEQPGTSDLANF